MTQPTKALRGTRDILPEEVSAWRFVEAAVHRIFRRYGFREIRTPVMEATELFARSVGESSDIVRKEMYTMERGRESMTLRPECTASVVRAFIEHSLHRGVAAGFPERYYYIGPMFRHERPQKGRLRQFHQIGVEVLGAGEPLVDAETLQMLDLFLEQVGVAERELVIGSVGDETCRPGYRDALRAWLRPLVSRLCVDCHRRYEENPLRVLDCKVESDRDLLREAPTMLDHLCRTCESHLADVRRFLEMYGVPYRLEGRLVRGLDYYRRTVFEIVSSRLGAQNAIVGGGRYDGLVEELGGPRLPGFGFAMGIERLILLLDSSRAKACRPDLALIGLGRAGWEASIPMARRLRAAGLDTMMAVCDRTLGAQLRRADRAGARFVLFVGEDELKTGRYGLKNLETAEQVTIEERDVPARVRGDDG